MKEPADLRIIGSSIQFSHEYNGWESWTNFPRELLKMVELIKSTKASGVVFISGDVHGASCRCCVRRIAIPSMISPRADSIATGTSSNPTRNRVGEACSDFHFGMLDIDWSGNPSITFRIHDMTGRARVRKSGKLRA